MARIGQLIYAPEVQDKASGPLNAIGQAADRTGAAFEQLDTRVRRGEASFDQAAAKLDAVERAAQRVEKATSSLTRNMEVAERAARAEGVAQERLSAVLAAGAAAREQAALQAVRGLTAEQQAAALTRAGYANLAAQVQATAQAQSNLGVRASQSLAAANDNVAGSGGRMSAALGQAGFQIQDFATQVSMGQNALVAFGTQFSQLAGFFGPAGAIAGAGVMIGVIAAQLLTMGDNAQEAARRAEAAFEGVKRETEELADVTEKINDLYLTQEERVRRVAAAARDALATMTGLQQSSLAMQLNSLTTELPGAQADVARLQREAEIERQLQERARRAGGLVPQDSSQDIQARAFTAQTRLMGLQQEIARVDALLERANRNAQDLADNLPIPPPEAAPEAERARASTERLTEAQREYQQIMREAEGQITRTLTEEERRANILDRLSQMLAEGVISGDQYVGAVETQRRAVEALRQQEEARLAERSAAEAERRAQQAAQTIERQNQQTTDSIVRYGADRFADMFSENSRGWAGMLDTFRSTFRSLMARLAAEAVIRPIVAPIVQGLGLGGIGSGGGLGSIFGGGSVMGGAPGVADPGGMRGGLNQAGQLLGLRGAGGFGNLGNAFTGQGLANTGFAGLDGLLNTQVVAPSLSTNGMIGAGGLPIVDGSAGLTAAGAIGGAASIAGGAYGVYSGLQRGGIGGYTSAAGGALSAGLGVAMLAGATIPVAGWVLAGLLAIAGAALPGQQQSGRGQLSRINLNTDNQTYEGLGGDRFSQGNRDAATNTVNSIADMARRIGDQLGGARIGGDVAVGVTSGRGSGPGTLYLQVGANTQAFANDEAGSKQLAETAARLILDEFRRQGTAQGDYAGILAASPTVEVLSQNLEWYEKTYKVLTQATQPVSAFQQSIDQLTAQFEPAIQKARELGLSVDDMTAARERELQKLRDERGTAARNFNNNLDVRMARAVGDNYNADLLAFDVQAEQQIKTARAELEALGLTAEEVAAGIARTERTLGAERLAIVRSYAESAAGSALGVVTSLRDYSRGLRTTDAGAGTALDRYTAAARQFDAIYGAAVAGDARSISGLQGAAETFRANAREVFGGGQGYADALRVIGQRIDAIGLMGPEALTQSFMAENATRQTNRIVETLQSEISKLRADINLLMMRPAAA